MYRMEYSCKLSKRTCTIPVIKETLSKIPLGKGRKWHQTCARKYTGFAEKGNLCQTLFKIIIPYLFDSKPGLTFFFWTLGGAYYRVGLTIGWGLLSKSQISASRNTLKNWFLPAKKSDYVLSNKLVRGYILF